MYLGVQGAMYARGLTMPGGKLCRGPSVQGAIDVSTISIAMYQATTRPPLKPTL